VAALSVAGFLISAYLTATALLGRQALFCEAGGACDIVQSSRWATFFGAPTAAWGAVVYAMLAALALAGLNARRWLSAFLLAVAAASFSAYLTYISAVILRALCPYCLAVAVIAGILVVVLALRRPHAVANRRWGRPARLVAAAAATAVVTVVFVAAAFMADAPRGGAGQEALARHLASSGAIFYGAYW
jgi:uncharacterized membrane protein